MCDNSVCHNFFLLKKTGDFNKKKILYFKVELPPALSNACNTMSPACPVAAGQQVTQSAGIPVSTELHGGVPVQLRVTMTNGANAINTCCLINLIVH